MDISVKKERGNFIRACSIRPTPEIHGPSQSDNQKKVYQTNIKEKGTTFYSSESP